MLLQQQWQDWQSHRPCQVHYYALLLLLVLLWLLLLLLQRPAQLPAVCVGCW
jgi:hypothetical protein